MRELTVAEISSVAGGIVVPNVDQRLNPDYSGSGGGGGSIGCLEIAYGFGMVGTAVGAFGGMGRIVGAGFSFVGLGVGYYCDTRAGS